MSDTCQSCRQAPVTVVETRQEFYEPLELCADCLARLDSHSLRPLEWYNLCAVHGHLSEALGEEHYDDAGRALAPAAEVIGADHLACPTLADVAASPEELLTYVLTHSEVHRDDASAWRSAGEEPLAALRRHRPGAVLSALSRRLGSTSNPDFIEAILGLCAEVLGEAGAGFVREHWARCEASAFAGVFRGLAHAAAGCLPGDEAFERLTGALGRMAPRERIAWKGVLGRLASPRVLDWIEANAASQIDISWGALAARSGLDWPRASAWLAAGRPLSLVALDALGLCLQNAFVRKDADAWRRLGLPAPDAFAAALDAYAAGDDVVRVRQSVAHLRSYADMLVAGR